MHLNGFWVLNRPVELLNQTVIITLMEKEFLTILKKKSHRERFYSSMTFDEFCDVYGPPTPFLKPQEAPVDDIPLFSLEAEVQTPATKTDPDDAALETIKMDTIYEIEASQNFTQHLQKSPRNDFYSSGHKSGVTSAAAEAIQAPKRMRVRMRSQSDNSQYLIFNFLERAGEKGRKKIKLD